MNNVDRSHPGSRRFAGAVTLVTGAGSGIGLGVAQRFADEGAAVIVADIDANAARAAAAEVTALAAGHGGTAHPIEVDVADAGSVAALVEQVVGAHGRLDHVVNSAGVSGAISLEALGEAEYERVLGIDLGGVYRVSRAAAPHLARGGAGAIVNIASIMATLSAKGYVAYSAAKAGVLGMTRALALELGPAVRVNAISPGFIDTAIWERLLARMEPSAAAGHAERVRSRHPVGRRGTPHDVAAAAAFLCSADAAFISGVELVVDGGVSANALAQEGGY